MTKEEDKTIKAAKSLGLDKVIPKVYEDTFQPAAKELGKSLTVVAKTIKIALAPVSSLVWGYEKIQEYVISALEKKFKKIPEDRIVSPELNIIGPLLESLKFSGYNPHLRNMYINLLASSMDKETIKYSHPAFIEIIKQLSSDEAKLLHFFAQNRLVGEFCYIHEENPANDYVPFEKLHEEFAELVKKSDIEFTDLAISYLDNLVRLKIVEVHNHSFDKMIQKVMTRYCMSDEEELHFEESWFEYMSISEFGIQFINACIDQSFGYGESNTNSTLQK